MSWLLDTSWMRVNGRPAWRVIVSWCSAYFGLGIGFFLAALLLAPFVGNEIWYLYRVWFAAALLAKTLCALVVPFGWPLILQDFIYYFLHNYQFATIMGR